MLLMAQPHDRKNSDTFFKTENLKKKKPTLMLFYQASKIDKESTKPLHFDFRTTSL
jgi:hypothetical protein